MTKEKDFFNVNIGMFKWAGIWIPNNASNLVKLGYGLFNSFWILYSICLFTPAEFLTVPETSKNVSDLVKNLNMAMTHLLATIKVIIWFINRNEILYILDTLRKNAIAFEKIGDYDPEKLIKEEKKNKDICSLLFLGMACFVSVSACFNSFIVLFTDYESQYGYNMDAFNQTLITYNQKLPYYSWIPWDYRASRFNFGCAILFQFFPVFNFAFIIVGFDTLYVSIISYTSVQLQIIQGAFRTIRARCYRELGMIEKPVLRETDVINAVLNKELNKGIKALQIIFVMCEKMEAIFTYVTLAQVLISMIVFCTCLYLTSSYPVTSEKFLVEFIYLIAIEMQLWLYCFFGNKVTYTGDDIPLSLYEGDWFSMNSSFKRSMMITMTRMRRPIYLTIGKFSPLTLSTFVTIGRASYSFFAVLKNSN